MSRLENNTCSQRSDRVKAIRATACVPIYFLVGATLLISSGCRGVIDQPTTNPLGYTQVSNPLVVPQIDRWLIMDQISDELDDYFRINREQRIRVVDSLMTEGWIETYPKIGATALEPWRKDSTPGFERLHATLQTVRRFAKVRVIPTEGSYTIDVKVYKELEDLPQPRHASISGRPLRNDNAVDIDDLEIFDPQPNKGWIPMGRDFSLEQQILRNIQGRIDQIMNQPGPPGH